MTELLHKVNNNSLAVLYNVMEVKFLGRYSGTGDKADLDNHSNQCNPNNDEYDGYQEG